MKTISNVDRDNLTEIARRSQNTHQCENYNIALYRRKDGAILEADDDCGDTQWFLLDESDGLDTNDLDAWLTLQAANWASNGDYPDGGRLEKIAWGLSDASDFACEPGPGERKIIAVYRYYGYQPVSYVTDDCGDELVFCNHAAAAEWIAAAQDRIYYLAHNEAGRPTYTIVDA